MKKLACFVLLAVLFPATSRAHFLWLLMSNSAGSGKVEVVFGEAAEPDDPALLDRVATAEVWSVTGRGEPTALSLEKSADSLTAAVRQPSTVILRHSYGVITRDNETFLLKYYAKTYPFPLPGTWRAVQDKQRLPLEIVPARSDAGVQLTVTWQGKPQADITVTVVGPGIPDKVEGTTNEKGQFSCNLPRDGRYSLRARFIEQSAGKLGDQEYTSVRHYSTLALPYAPSMLKPLSHELPPLPQGITSFGGAVVGDTLLVYGGNYGTAHEYAHEDQSGDLWQLELRKPGSWKKVLQDTRLQGLAMVEHRGAIYRIGGFTAQNKTLKEEQDLRSQADFARLNKERSSWESLPGLPEPRSSHDAAVVGDTLFVVGGWNMPGGGEQADWHDTALACRLNDDQLAWKTIAPPPFQRRALALAAWQGKLYCVGGMQEAGGPTTAVAVYDPSTDSWSEGPRLLGNAMDGFGSSAFACQDGLYVTTISGSIQRLRGDGSAWEYVGQIDHPRFFHRLLPWGDSRLLVVGGASMEEGKAVELELLAPGERHSVGP